MEIKPTDASASIVHHLSLGQYAYLLSLTAWVCAMMNGIIPSIQSFASLPYGQVTIVSFTLHPGYALVLIKYRELLWCY